MRLVLAAAAAAVLGGGFSPSAEWAPRELPISFWCGPPDPHINVEQYRRIAEAGFNWLMPPCEGASTRERNLRILDTARAAGLKAFLQDERIPNRITGEPDARQRLDAVVADYSRHPAFAGYFVWDEAPASMFAGLGEVVSYLREKDPAHPAYLNIWPNYAGPRYLGTATYAEHVTEFLRQVKPFVLSYDHYPFLKERDRPEYFSNLTAIRTHAQRAAIPFWQIIQLVPHGGYRPVTEGELRWQAFHTLAHGGQGVMYFTYWTPDDPAFQWGPAIIARDGTPTPQYEVVKRVNADLRAVGRHLVRGVHATVFHAGTPAPGSPGREEGTPVEVPGPGDVSVGLWRADTHLYVLCVNRNYRAPTRTELHCATAGRTVERLDRRTGRWSRIRTESTLDGALKAVLELAAGDGELLRW